MQRNRHTALRGLNVLSWVVMAAVNALAELLPLGGVTTGEASAAWPNLFTPAGYTFAVWGVIYFLLLAFTVWQAAAVRFPPAAERMGPLFALSSAYNVAWLFCWHYGRVVLSLLCMAGLLLSLAAAYARLTCGPLTDAELLFAKLPFSVYLGWVTVASVANAAAALTAVGWHRFGLPAWAWTVIVLVAGTLLGLLVTRRKRAPAYGLTMTWAYLGILSRHVRQDGFDGAYPLVIWAAGVGAAALLLTAVLVALRDG